MKNVFYNVKRFYTIYDFRFGELVEQLINLLVGLKAAPSTTPLSQLLLRLDFNHWFSVKKHNPNITPTTE